MYDSMRRLEDIDDQIFQWIFTYFEYNPPPGGKSGISSSDNR